MKNFKSYLPDKNTIVDVVQMNWLNGKLYSIHYYHRGEFIPTVNFQIMRPTGLNDKNGTPIYSDYLLKDIRSGIIFRVYDVVGGCVMKESKWKEDIKDWHVADYLVCHSFSDPQLIAYASESFEIIGTIYEV